VLLDGHGAVRKASERRDGGAAVEHIVKAF
jgi:hypothetical protein